MNNVSKFFHQHGFLALRLFGGLIPLVMRPIRWPITGLIALVTMEILITEV